MKKILICTALLGCMTSGCKKIERIYYSGIFKLDKQVVSGGGKDTALAKEQMKIYTDHNYMYAGMAPDSSVAVGVGSYELDSGNRIVEHNIFNNRALDSAQIFVVLINKTDNGRTEVIPDFAANKNVKYKMTEGYVKLPVMGASNLDGVWNMDEAFRVKGKDTLKQQQTQFKVFWRGHFMFIHHYPIGALGAEYKNGFGYGTFSLKNDTLNEEDKMSSHAILLNRKFVIKIIFNGKDKYSQITRDPKTKEQTTEIYRRLP
ncbi:MAG: hypothetical protein JWP78_1032 [Mucilaginibacter sp.]|nr:hypothetical protein [Mucilaginibacter sp.]